MDSLHLKGAIQIFRALSVVLACSGLLFRISVRKFVAYDAEMPRGPLNGDRLIPAAQLFGCFRCIYLQGIVLVPGGI